MVICMYVCMYVCMYSYVKRCERWRRPGWPDNIFVGVWVEMWQVAKLLFHMFITVYVLVTSWYRCAASLNLVITFQSCPHRSCTWFWFWKKSHIKKCSILFLVLSRFIYFSLAQLRYCDGLLSVVHRSVGCTRVCFVTGNWKLLMRLQNTSRHWLLATWKLGHCDILSLNVMGHMEMAMSDLAHRLGQGKVHQLRAQCM